MLTTLQNHWPKWRVEAEVKLREKGYVPATASQRVDDVWNLISTSLPLLSRLEDFNGDDTCWNLLTFACEKDVESKDGNGRHPEYALTPTISRVVITRWDDPPGAFDCGVCRTPGRARKRLQSIRPRFRQQKQSDVIQATFLVVMGHGKSGHLVRNSDAYFRCNLDDQAGRAGKGERGPEMEGEGTIREGTSASPLDLQIDFDEAVKEYGRENPGQAKTMADLVQWHRDNPDGNSHLRNSDVARHRGITEQAVIKTMDNFGTWADQLKEHLPAHIEVREHVFFRVAIARLRNQSAVVIVANEREDSEGAVVVDPLTVLVCRRDRDEVAKFVEANAGELMKGREGRLTVFVNYRCNRRDKLAKEIRENRGLD